MSEVPLKSTDARFFGVVFDSMRHKTCSNLLFPNRPSPPQKDKQVQKRGHVPENGGGRESFK